MIELDIIHNLQNSFNRKNCTIQPKFFDCWNSWASENGLTAQIAQSILTGCRSSNGQTSLNGSTGKHAQLV